MYCLPVYCFDDLCHGKFSELQLHGSPSNSYFDILLTCNFNAIEFRFYCVNSSYPMDNCFTGRRDRSRQTSEKDVLYILPAGPVTECAFARWRIVLHFLFTPIDVIASFSFGAKECAEVFLQRYVFEVLQRTLPSFVFFISTE